MAIDQSRILTGDIEGYVYAWSLENCLDQTMGPDKLCLRYHRAIKLSGSDHGAGQTLSQVPQRNKTVWIQLGPIKK